ncbi:hypothetical protein QBC34DRAFT_157585 [Podospora aff. communis PSN243]|uniref:Uncharacterized protein n=1 Tax=Podospora aff. communis PSN243 TaxID=3040156 RepID=A0AAV9H0Q5_9PEZI|nr:hypothetical protein QBC34DRAFT_157585 [Podospora aff. communis PSN243]
MFMRRSCNGHALSLLERSRSCSGVTSPGSPSERSLIGAGRGALASSGAISSIVDLKRTAGGVCDFCSPPATGDSLWTVSIRRRPKVSQCTLGKLCEFLSCDAPLRRDITGCVGVQKEGQLSEFTAFFLSLRLTLLCQNALLALLIRPIRSRGSHDCRFGAAGKGRKIDTLRRPEQKQSRRRRQGRRKARAARRVSQKRVADKKKRSGQRMTRDGRR